MSINEFHIKEKLCGLANLCSIAPCMCPCTWPLDFWCFSLSQNTCVWHGFVNQHSGMFPHRAYREESNKGKASAQLLQTLAGRLVVWNSQSYYQVTSIPFFLGIRNKWQNEPSSWYCFPSTLFSMAKWGLHTGIILNLLWSGRDFFSPSSDISTSILDMIKAHILCTSKHTYFSPWKSI